ncbi:hypothetical protein BJ917_4165 [Pseudomonas sp. WPR_5_2]|nr:hypothetical protein BJ917_4165 [Pseudomonas sp. WPR_5_2]
MSDLIFSEDRSALPRKSRDVKFDRRLFDTFLLGNETAGISSSKVRSNPTFVMIGFPLYIYLLRCNFLGIKVNLQRSTDVAMFWI